MDQQSIEKTKSRYLNFADYEARGRSLLYEELALSVADDAEVLSFLAKLPVPKQQPNLLFAAVKFLFGAPADWGAFKTVFERHSDDIRTVMLSKSTQTNPDRYGYEFDSQRIDPDNSLGIQFPIFSCQTNRSISRTRVEVVWRAGMDLSPIDVNDDGQVAWLEALVWPDEERRLELLRAALAVAKSDPPRVVRGDLRKDLPALAAEAPKAATLVVFHTSVLCYVHDLGERQAFARAVRGLSPNWISNEGSGVLPWISEKVREPWPGNRLLMGLNEKPIAWTDPHGKSIQFLVPPAEIDNSV